MVAAMNARGQFAFYDIYTDDWVVTDSRARLRWRIPCHGHKSERVALGPGWREVRHAMVIR